MGSQQLKCHSTTGTNKKNTEGMVDNQSYTLVSHKHNRKHTLGTKKPLSQTNKHRQNVKDTTNAKKKTLNMPETKSKKRKNTQEKCNPTGNNKPCAFMTHDQVYRDKNTRYPPFVVSTGHKDVYRSVPLRRKKPEENTPGCREHQ